MGLLDRFRKIKLPTPTAEMKQGWNNLKQDAVNEVSNVFHPKDYSAEITQCNNNIALYQNKENEIGQKIANYNNFKTTINTLRSSNDSIYESLIKIEEKLYAGFNFDGVTIDGGQTIKNSYTYISKNNELITSIISIIDAKIAELNIELETARRNKSFWYGQLSHYQ